MTDGAVCRKNLAHKRMCRQISNPKILMVAKNLEFNRAQSRLTSLEGMTKQEVSRAWSKNRHYVSHL